MLYDSRMTIIEAAFMWLGVCVFVFMGLVGALFAFAWFMACMEGENKE